VAIRDHWKRWPDFIEVFERRNLIAHGEKIFTKRYTSICHKNGHKGSEKTLGTAVNLTSKYLKQAADLLLEFGILLVFSLWRKQFPAQEPDAFRNLNQVAFKLIENRNYITSIRVLNYALGLKKINMEDIIKKMMYVNLASAHRHSNEKDKCIRVLDEVDWSGSSDDYKLCVAALKDDVQKVIDLMGLVAGSGKITKSDFREWPVFDFIRDNGEFCEKYLEVFGEPLREADEVKVMELSEPDATDVVSVSREGSTVH
jgi:hypothetical protein